MPLELVKDWVQEYRPTSSSQSSREREFLPAALEIIESPASPAGRLIALSIAAAVVIALLWACIGKVDVIATAAGRIIPIGSSKVLQPIDVGLVKAIRVTDGDYVREGQVLIELDPVQARAERDRYSEELQHAELELGILNGLWNSLKSHSPPHLAGVSNGASAEDIAAAQSDMRARYDEQVAALADLDQQVIEKQAEAAGSNNAVSKLQASLPYVQQQVDLRNDLLKLQYSSKLAYLQAQQALVEQTHEITVLQSEKSRASAEKLALEQKRQEAADTYEKTLLDDLNKTQAQVSELRAGLVKAQDSLSAKTLRAPISGTVQELAIHTIGGVVTPAQSLLTIVPSGGGLIVEAMVNNRDVGFVHVGQPAKVKVDAFNFTRYGLIDGTVLGLSHDTVDRHVDMSSKKDADGADSGAAPEPPEPAYVARIHLSQNWMETETGRVGLGPGMVVTAEIRTGRRRIIDYLLSPLKNEVTDSLHER